jgi:hypothetical protein
MLVEEVGEGAKEVAQTQLDTHTRLRLPTAVGDRLRPAAIGCDHGIAAGGKPRVNTDNAHAGSLGSAADIATALPLASGRDTAVAEVKAHELPEKNRRRRLDLTWTSAR